MVEDGCSAALPQQVYSPIFAVAKKNGGIRLVQDFKTLNAQIFVDKYSMKDVSECIGKISRLGS